MGFALRDGIPIVVPGSTAVAGETLRIEITEERPNALVGTIDALPKHRQPTIGEVINIPESKSLSPPLMTSEFGVDCPAPLRIPDIPVKSCPPIRVGIERIDSDHVFASIEGVRKTHRPSLGEKIVATITQSSHEGARARVGQFPILIPGDTIESGETVQVGISQYRAETIVASASDLPKPERPIRNDIIEIPKSGSLEEPLQPSEIPDNPPVPLVLPDNYPSTGRKSRVGVDRVNSDSIYATTSALPADSLPSGGESIIVQIHTSAKDHSIAFHEDVPVFIRIGGLERETQFEVEVEEITKIGIEVTLTAVRPQSGSDIESLSPYISNMQEGVAKLREGTYGKAANSFETAADAIGPCSGVPALWWDAQRYAALTRCEAYRQQDAFQKAAETLQKLHDDTKKVDPKAGDFIHAVFLELKSAAKSIKALERLDDTSDFASIQKIGVKSELRGEINEAQHEIARIKEISRGRRFSNSIPLALTNRLLEAASEEFDFPVEYVDRYLSNVSTTVEDVTWSPPVPLSLRHIDEFDNGNPQPQQTTQSEPSQNTNTDKSNTGPNHPSRSARSHTTDEVEPDDSKSVPEESGENKSEVKEAGKDGVGVEIQQYPDSRDAGRSRERSVDPEILRKLRSKAEDDATDSPARDGVSSTTSKYARSSAIKTYAKARADGHCEWCEERAPFQSKTGTPYLEVHHVDELGEGGSDRPEKVMALCPTCHTKIHYGVDGVRTQ